MKTVNINGFILPVQSSNVHMKVYGTVKSEKTKKKCNKKLQWLIHFFSIFPIMVDQEVDHADSHTNTALSTPMDNVSVVIIIDSSYSKGPIHKILFLSYKLLLELSILQNIVFFCVLFKYCRYTSLLYIRQSLTRNMRLRTPKT